MGAEVTLIPAVVSAQCSSGAVRVQYTIHLESDSYSGDVGAGETDLVDDDIVAAVEDLTKLIKAKMEEAAGLSSGDENPLGDEPSVASYDDEDPL